MPIYEYQCDQCGKTIEVLQKISDPPPAQHTCGSTRLHRVMSQSSFVLKGTGWYLTDYARKDKNNGAGATKEPSENSSAKPKTESKTESKTDSKTESKTGSKTESRTESKPLANAA
jgi:putative FmdB family regulatory protein